MVFISGRTSMAQDTQSAQPQRQGDTQGGRRQRRGNFDPAQFQQRMLERYKERLEITDDSEWNAIQPLIQKVMDARLAVASGARGMFARRGRRSGEASQGDQAQGQRRPLASASPAAQQLQQAIDSKAPAAEMKTALTKYQQYRTEKQAELEKAQTALRNVLSARQEAIATLSGLL